MLEQLNRLKLPGLAGRIQFAIERTVAKAILFRQVGTEMDLMPPMLSNAIESLPVFGTFERLC